MRNEIIDFITKKYNAAPEYLWRHYPSFCIFRHANNNKWFALIATMPRKTLKLSGEDTVDIMNIKTSNAEFLRGVPGILPAYHMNKANWVTVLLDGTVSIKNIKKLIEMSFDITNC